MSAPIRPALPLLLATATTFALVPSPAAAGPSSEGGFRIISVTPGPSANVEHAVTAASLGPLDANGGPEMPPLEGPVMSVAMTVTDQADGMFEFFATTNTVLAGSPLPGATTNRVIGLLDSGSSTHLMSYTDALEMGLQGSFLSGNTFGVGGVCGSADLDLSMPVGFFAHGLQDLDAGGNLQTSLLLGQGNFAGGANTFDNYSSGINPPTLIGAPFLFFYPASIRNSELVESSAVESGVSSPSITFYADPDDPQIPVLARKIFMETRPVGGVVVAYVFDFDGLPNAPSTILGASAGSLFFTASAMTFREGTNVSSGKMVVDTGAQATLLSEIAAAELGLDLVNPDFEVEVQGIGCSLTAPGFYIDSASIPAGGGTVPISWASVPVVVLNVGSPEGGTLYGIFGNNLTASRDLVFNGAVSPPYLALTEPIVPPTIEITDIRLMGPDTAEVDWRCEPAQPLLQLEQCSDLTPDPPVWTVVATSPMPTIQGTMSVTGLVSRAFFRIKAP